jgi:hypothetical protein
MKKIVLILAILTQQIAQAQLPLNGDTVIYTKINKTVKELLPKAIDFFTTKTTVKEVTNVYTTAKYSKLNNDKNFTLIFDDKTNAKIKYILGGNTSDNIVEFIRVSSDETNFAAILKTIGTKTITDKGTDYWFFLTKDGYKFFVVLNKMGKAYTAAIGIKPKTWVHLIKK